MLYPWVRSGNFFFTIEIGQEIFSRDIFSRAVFSYWLKQKIKTINYSSSSLLKKLARVYEQYFVAIQSGLYLAWLGAPKTGFLVMGTYVI